MTVAPSRARGEKNEKMDIHSRGSGNEPGGAWSDGATNAGNLPHGNSVCG
jgi:hypothetical protein